MNEFLLNIVARLNKRLSKRTVSGDLKTLDNSMYVKVIAKLSKTLTRKALNQQLKQLNNLEVQVGTKVKMDGKAKSRIQKNIKSLQTSLSDLEIGIKTSKSSNKINSDIDSIKQTAQKKAKKDPISIDLDIIKKDKLLSDITYLGKRYSKLFSNVSMSKKYENILNSAYSASDDKQLRNTRAELQAFTSELKACGLAAKSVGDKWKGIISRFKDLVSVAATARLIIDQTKKAVTTTLELDKAYTDLVKVQNDLTRNDYPEYLDKCNQKAKKLAASQKGLMEGAAEFSKSGYNLSTSDKLTEKSTILSNVGEMEASDSAKAIISGVQAYDTIDGYTDVVDKAGALVDKYNAVGNTASITSAEIAQGVQSVGSVFADANSSVDEFVALLSAGNRQFQDADSLALGLRTSALRIRGCTTELEAMGEETDGVCTSASNLEKKIKGLTNVNGNGGVEILEADGETFRSIYDIFLDISKVYKEMSDTDQSALLELIAGKHRASAVSATLNNMGEAEQILQTSLNAAGSAQKEYDEYLKSSEAHIQQFQATLVETYSTFMNGDMISHVADLGSSILELVNKTDLLKHGILAVLALNIGKGITAIGAGIASTAKQMNTLGNAIQQVKNLPLDKALRKDVIDNIGESTKALTEKNLKLLLSQKQLSQSDAECILKVQGLTEEEALAKLEKMGLTTATTAQTAANTAEATSTSVLSGAMTSLKASVSGLWAVIKANPLGVFLTVGTTAYSILSSVISNYNQEAEEAKQKTKELADEVVEEENNIVSLIEQYNKLDKTDRSTENTEELKNLNKQINDYLGEQAESIDLINGKLDEQSKKLQRNLLQKLKDDKTSLDASVSVSKGDYDDGAEIGAFFDFKGDIGDILGEYGATSLDGRFGKIDVDKANVGAILESQNTEQQIKQLNEWLEILNKADKEAGVGTYSDEISTLQDKLNEAEEIKKAYDKALANQKKNEGQQKILSDSLDGKISSVKEFEEYRNQIKATYKDNETLQNQMLDFANTIFPTYAKKISEAGKATSDNNSKSKIKPQGFKSVWDSIGTTGDKEAKKAEKEEKKRLKELAEAGKLTEEELSKSSLAKKFEDAGVSIAKATKEINKFKSSADQLASMKTGISSISSILGEKKEKQSSKKTRNEGIGADALAGMPDDLKDQKKEYEHFVEVLGDGSSSMEDCRKAANKLATAYVNSNNFLSKLTDKTKDYYTSVLTEMGVENAAQVVQQSLNTKKVDEMLLNWDIVNATEEEIAAKAAEVGALEGANQALKDYAFQKALASKGALDTSSSVANLITLAKQCGVTGDSLKELQKLQILLNESTSISENKSMSSTEKALRLGSLSGQIAAQQTKIANTANKKVKVKSAYLNVNPKHSDSSKSKKDKSNKSSKQTFDWMERRFKNLQNVIDLTASKLQNLFSVKAKNSNLNKQIKTTTKLINAYGIAAKKYQQKADQVAAGSTKTVKGKNGKKKKVKTKALSKGIIQKIQTGKLTKKTKLSSLITEYGQSTAEKIQSYIDYYDKAQDAKKNKQDQKAKKRELKQQKYQNYADLYDSRTARAEAKEAIQVKAADKNKAVDTQLKNTKLSYQYQIKIANLTKNKAEAEKLQYELDKKVTQLKLQQIQNLQDEYDKRVGLFDNDAQDIDNAIALAQARGQTLSAGYYQSLNKIQTTKRQEAVTEKSKVETELAAALKDGSIKEGSDEWYEVQSTLHGLDNTISECDVSIAENTTAIRELHTTMLEEMAENASRMNTEADFLANLLSRRDLTDSDTGTFTNAGLGTLGTYGINMETAQAQMRELEKERAILEEMKKTGSLDYDDNGKHKYDSVNQLEEAYNNILDKQQEWTQNEYDAEQKILDLMKEYYQAQLDYMKEIIDAKKTALDYEKDLYSYQKSLAEKTKSIATLEKQAAALKGDTSEEGRARLAKIQLNLDEANQDLQDTEYERYISEQQNMLDNMYSEYEDLMNHLFKDTDKLLQEGIQVINNNGGLIKSILDKTAEDYSYNYSDRFSKITDAFMTSDNIVTGIKDSINGKEDSSISKRLETINTTIENKYAPPSYGSGSGGGGSNGGSTGNPSGTTGGTTQQTQTKNGQTGVTPDAMDEIEGINEKNRKLKNALNSMKGPGFEKYWKIPNKKEGEPKTHINKRIAANPNYDKKYPNGKRSPQILTEKGLKRLAEELGVKYPSSESAKTADLNQYVKDAHFQTGGIVRANGVPLKGDNIPIRVNPNETVLTQDFTDVLPKAVDAMDQFVKEMNLEPYSPPNATLAKLASLVPDYNLMPDVKPIIPKPESVVSNNVSKETFGNQTFGDIHVCLELPNVTDYKSFREEMRSDNTSRHMFEVMVDDCLHKRGVTKRIKL